MAVRITSGTKTLEIESVRDASLVFSAVASLTMSAILASLELAAGAVTSSRISPCRLVVPAVTWSPVDSSCGRDSPVSVEASIVAAADKSLPSAGIACPAATSTIIFFLSSAVEISCRFPSISTVALSGIALSSARTESVALFLAFTSM